MAIVIASRRVHIQACVAMASLCAYMGCATRITAVRPLGAQNETMLNDIVAGRKAKLTLQGKAEGLDSTDVRLAGSTVRFLERDPATSIWRPEWLPETKAPLASVQRIEFRETGRGALHGFGIGAATGGIAGFVAGMSIPWSCDKDCRGVFVPLTTLAGAVGFGLVGAALGGAIGAPTTIEFSDTPSH